MSSLVETDTPEAKVTPPVKPENPNVTTLKAAFPDVDPAVISAVLIASSNNLEKAFDGLLGMSDPDFQPDPPAAPAPVDYATEEEQRQILADEQFARQLAYEGNRRQRTPGEQQQQQQQQQQQYRSAGRGAARGQVQQEQQHPLEPEHSFLDDDLPVLKENIIQGFNETKIKVGSFISNLRTQYNQRMENPAGGAGGNGSAWTGSTRPDGLSSGTGTTGGGGRGVVGAGAGAAGGYQPDLHHGNPRSSTQYDRDARTLDDDFGELELQDNSGSGEYASSVSAAGNMTMQPRSLKQRSSLETVAAEERSKGDEGEGLARSAGVGPSSGSGGGGGGGGSGRATSNGPRWQPITPKSPGVVQERKKSIGAAITSSSSATTTTATTTTTTVPKQSESFALGDDDED